jgi:hypothetical protein
MDPGGANQYGGMSIEVGGCEEGRGSILHQRLLVRFRSDPESDDIGVSLTRVRVDRIRPRRSEEDE